jgi:hypothetical protein
MTLVARPSRLPTDEVEISSVEGHEIECDQLHDQPDRSASGKHVPGLLSPIQEARESVESEDGRMKTVRALASIAFALSLTAIVMPVEQFAVAIPAVILAIATGYCGERTYTAATAVVTAVNMAMLSPHDDLVMIEQPILVYWTALMWSAAPIVAMIVGYFTRRLARM